MDTYQQELVQMFSGFRPAPNYPTYPPYHSGPYLEEYFFDYFCRLGGAARYYIPVYWTNCYLGGVHGVQSLLDNLDPNKKYFTISQHDDAVKESLPPDTLCFNAGGNGGGIPVPLICSPIQAKEEAKDIFCSFVGSMTHPIRTQMYNTLSNNSRYVFHCQAWSPFVGNDTLAKFISTTSRSIFCLCPRGYGKTSFRLYEAMQLGSIPVYIYNDKWCPFSDTLDWDDFCVLVHASEIEEIDNILLDIDFEDVQRMRKNLLPVWESNFTMESVSRNVIQRL